MKQMLLIHIRDKIGYMHRILSMIIFSLTLLIIVIGTTVRAAESTNVKLFLPAVVKAFNQFVLEVEPNSTFETANTLLSPMTFRGYAGDDFDFILIDHFPSGPFMVTLENPADPLCL